MRNLELLEVVTNNGASGCFDGYRSIAASRGVQGGEGDHCNKVVDTSLFELRWYA